jgi:hypothetical protein
MPTKIYVMNTADPTILVREDLADVSARLVRARLGDELAEFVGTRSATPIMVNPHLVSHVRAS